MKFHRITTDWFFQIIGPLAYVAVALAFTNSCRDASDIAKTKSLNNFARNSGDLARNTCSGSQQVVLGIHREWDHVDFSAVDPAQVPALKNALSKSLSAVPENLQHLYFGLGGKIVFSSKLNDPAKSSADLTCQRSAANDQFASEGTGRVEACWTIDTKTSDVVVLMNPSVESIQHSTVRIFGYILSQILTKIGVEKASGDGVVLVAQKDAAFEKLMDDIAGAVIADVKRPGSKYTLAVNESLVRTDQFKYFAFAESFDSFYCNTALRQSMARSDEFPKTYALFVQMDRKLSEVRVMPESSASAASRSDGFKLSGSEFNPELGDGLQLGILGGLFGGLMRVAGGLGGGLLRGIGGIGKGIVGLGGGLLGGAGKLLGGAANGIGGLLGGAGGGLINMLSNLFGGGG